MATVIEERRFSLTNIDGRNNKFWNVKLYDNGDVECHWGSQGATGQSKNFPGAGRSLMEKKIREKTSAGHKNGAYVENKVLGVAESTGTPTRAAPAKNLHAKAMADMGGSQSPELAKLIKYFADVNAHNLLEASGGKITYDASAGTFKTTQGVISLDQIEEARRYLDQITKFAEKSDFGSSPFKNSVGAYMSLVPQAGLVRQMNLANMFGLSGGLQRQNDMLDGLESSYAAVIAAPKSDKPVTAERPMFKVNMEHIESGDDRWKWVKKYYNSTKGSHYDVATYDVVRVYTLCIQDMADAFEKKGKVVGNIMRLWHGTKASNMLSILKAGMIVPRSGGAIAVTGRMFGDGLYFSDQSTKSIRYATGAWGGGGGSDRKFMFLVDVAMGKMYVPRNSFSGGCKAGFDSTFAKGGESGVANNEMIVYKTAQASPVMICEFTPYGK